jgi:putative transposase
METANTIRVDPTINSKPELQVVGDRVSRLWNSGNYLCRQHFLNKKGVPVGVNLENLMKATPEYRQLPSDVAQETLKKLSEAWRSYFALRAKWNKDPVKCQKPGLPKYRKDRKTGERPFDLIPIKSPRSYAIDAKDVHLVLPRDRRPKGKASGRLHIAYRGRVRHTGKMGRAEVRYDRVRRRWYMSWFVRAETPEPVESQRVAAIDLGVRIVSSLSIEGQTLALHFDGREILKDWDFLGEEIAREQKAIAGTRGQQPDQAPFSRNISLLYAKRRGRQEHALRCIGKEIAELCQARDVGTVFIGWPKDIRRDKAYNSLWAGRIHNFWSFDRASKVLANALRAVGITTVRVGERGSSSTCPCCGSKDVVRSPRWLLVCRSCGERIHSDQAGSRNIAKFQKPSLCWDGAEAALRTETRRWSRHLWELRFANPGLQTVGDSDGLLEFLYAA